MPKIDYLRILLDAWKITWKNRFLWWFGLFLILPAVFNFRYSLTDAEKSQFQDFAAGHVGLILIAMIFFVIIFAAFLALSFLGRGALIKSTENLLKKEPTGFKLGFLAGKKYFWKVFSIMFFSGLAFLFCLAVISIPIAILFYAKSYAIAIPLTILAILIIIPLLILYKFLQLYACFYVVLADLTPWAAVENAYAIFKKNILAGIVMSLCFIPLTIFVFLVFFGLTCAALIIFGLIGLALFFIFKKTGLIVAIVLGLAVLAVTTVILCSILTAFSQVAWVLFFYVIAATPKEEEKVAGENIKETEKAKELAHLPTADAVKTVEVEE